MSENLEKLVEFELKKKPVFIEKFRGILIEPIICNKCGKDIYEGVPLLRQFNSKLLGPYCNQKCADEDLIIDYGFQRTQKGWINYMFFWN